MRTGTGRLEVFTFKEGLLARAAHDLQFTLPRFSASLEGEAVTADILLGELRLVGPVEHGVVQPGRYDAGKRADVEKTMREEILRLGRHPTARFAGRAVPRGEELAVDGTLELAGAGAPLAFTVSQVGAEHHARFELAPSRWGIAPYKAMLGTIRLQDRVRIELALRES